MKHLPKFIIFFTVILFVHPALGRSAPKNGVVREYHTNGKLRLENVWKREIIVRKRTFYFNGRALSDFQYKHGELVKARTFYDNGKLKSHWTKKHGVTKHYYKDGRLKAVVNTRPKDYKKLYKSSYIFSE